MAKRQATIDDAYDGAQPQAPAADPPPAAAPRGADRAALELAEQVAQIPFVEADGSENVVPMKGDRAERAKRNREAAKKFVEAQKSAPPPPPAELPKLEPLSPEEVARRRPKLYRVVEDRTLAKGAGEVKFKAGKIISTRGGYDIPGLVRQGVKLVPVDDE